MTSLTEKQQQWLEDLVFKGQTTTTVKIVNDMITLELSSMTGTTQLATERAMSSIEGSSVYVLHIFAITSLSQALTGYETKSGKETFVTPTAALEFIKSRPTTIIDAMVKAHSEFEKELQQLITPEKLLENFTMTPGTEAVSSST